MENQNNLYNVVVVALTDVLNNVSESKTQTITIVQDENNVISISENNEVSMGEVVLFSKTYTPDCFDIDSFINGEYDWDGTELSTMIDEAMEIAENTVSL